MPTPRNPLLTPRYPLLTAGLRRYFYSGWAFLIPYLAAYLLYYVTKWPVNPVGGTPNSPFPHSLIPPLLHVYWTLHAIHVVLAGIALWSALRASESEKREALSEVTLQPNTSNFNWSAKLTALAPWILLALLFYIPGVYLEWPSDPWEHLRRINEWRILDTVGAHSSWMKSAYFIPYSLLSWCIGLRQLFWLDFYYTGICLLLCWQYYRFSRACGLGERASMVFMIIQALLFGNNIFSFYRYYGISSSIYAQLGAVALTRVFLEWAARGTMLDPLRLKSLDEARQCGDGETRGLRQAARPERSGGLSERESTGRNDNNLRHDHEIPNPPSPQTPIPLAPGVKKPSSNAECSFASALQPFSLLALKPYLLSLITAVTCLLALTAMNHPQGLGIAALGVAAVAIWRVIEWKRSAALWLLMATVVLSLLALWKYPKPAVLDQIYRPQGYLNAWYGFNLLDLNSLSGDRMLQIIGTIGLANLAAALLLFRRNQVIAWLTVMPFLALLIPCVSIPFATALSLHGDPTSIITFQRMLFDVPPGLALAMGIRGFIKAGLRLFSATRPSPPTDNGNTRRQPFRPSLSTLLPGILQSAPLVLVCATMTALVTLSASKPSYNHIWHALAVTPDDLQLRAVWSHGNTYRAPPRPSTAEACTSGLVAVNDILRPPPIYFTKLRTGVTPSDDLVTMQKMVEATGPGQSQRVVLTLIKGTEAYTPCSFASLGSTHWRPQEIAGVYAGRDQLIRAGNSAHFQPINKDSSSDSFTVLVSPP